MSLRRLAGFVEVGGWEEMMEKYKTAAANYTLAYPANYSCGLPRDDYMHIWRDPVTGDIPWTGAVFGLTTLGLWVWCTDQVGGSQSHVECCLQIHWFCGRGYVTGKYVWSDL